VFFLRTAFLEYRKASQGSRGYKIEKLEACNEKVYFAFSPSRFVLLFFSASSSVSSPGWQVPSNFVVPSNRAEKLTSSHG